MPPFKFLVVTGMTYLLAAAVPSVEANPLARSLLKQLVTRDPPTALPENATTNDKK